jgi:hypothetical protein
VRRASAACYYRSLPPLVPPAVCARSAASDPVMLNFTRFLLKNNEHTWGKSGPKFFGDYSNWSKCVRGEGGVLRR